MNDDSGTHNLKNEETCEEYSVSPKAKDHLRKNVLKAYRLQAENKFSKVIDHFTLRNQYEHLNNLDIEGKDIRLKQHNLQSIQKTDHLGEIKQMAVDKRKDDNPRHHIYSKNLHRYKIRLNCQGTG